MKSNRGFRLEEEGSESKLVIQGINLKPSFCSAAVAMHLGSWQQAAAAAAAAAARSAARLAATRKQMDFPNDAIMRLEMSSNMVAQMLMEPSCSTA